MDLYNSSELIKSKKTLSDILSINPNSFDYYQLAEINIQLGAEDEAISAFYKAIELKPDFIQAYESLRILLQKNGNFEEAEKVLNKIIRLHPNSKTYNSLACVQINLKKFDEGINNLKKALELEPDFVQAQNNLGKFYFLLGNNFVSQKKIKEAQDCYLQAIDISPEVAEVYYNLGNTYIESGLYQDAIEYFQKAINLNPNYHQAYTNIGNSFNKLSKFNEAILYFEKAIYINPNFSGAYYNLGSTLFQIRKFEEAEAMYKKAISLNPDYVISYNNLGSLYITLGLLDKAEDCFEKAFKINPDELVTNSNRIFLLQYKDNLDMESLKTALENYAKIFENINKINEYTNKKDKNKKIKLGYISGDFKNHSCALFIESLLEKHNKDKFEIYCYSNVERKDNITEKLMLLSEHWRDLLGKGVIEILNIIQNDQIDILIDLSGHTYNNLLNIFAYKPAPVQLTWLGFPGSTGLKEIDYKISDAYLTPDDTEEYFSEKIYNLNIPMHCFKPITNAPEIKPLPYLKNGFITFGSFNSLPKISTKTIQLWSGILNKVENSKLMIKTFNLSSYFIKNTIINSFTEFGITEERIIILELTPDTFEHLDKYNEMDIALDSFPYNGATTTAEALWMGVPVISLVGYRTASRYGLSFLSAIGLNKFVANTEEEYINKAVELANNIEELKLLRFNLRDIVKNSSLCDSVTFTREFENALRFMWKKWCN